MITVKMRRKKVLQKRKKQQVLKEGKLKNKKINDIIN